MYRNGLRALRPFGASPPPRPSSSRRWISELLSMPSASVSKVTPSSLAYPKGWGPERYRTIPFMKEDLRSVIEEVPDVPYYQIGEADPKEYPFKEIPVDHPIPYEVSPT